MGLFFLTDYEGVLLPIEVKAADNTKAKSLGVYLREYSPDLAIKASLKGHSDTGVVHSVPLYALGLLVPSLISSASTTRVP